jgi:hypothetical protein
MQQPAQQRQMLIAQAAPHHRRALRDQLLHPLPLSRRQDRGMLSGIDVSLVPDRASIKDIVQQPPSVNIQVKRPLPTGPISVGVNTANASIQLRLFDSMTLQLRMLCLPKRLASPSGMSS